MLEKIKEILLDDTYDTTIIDDYYKRGDITFAEYHEAIDKLRTAQAKDITEIVEKENNSIIDYEYCQRWLDYKGKEFIKEIAELKSKISRLEANEKIYHERLKGNKDNIIGVLKKYIFKDYFIGIDNVYDDVNNKTLTIEEFIEQIADEILKGE